MTKRSEKEVTEEEAIEAKVEKEEPEVVQESKKQKVEKAQIGSKLPSIELTTDDGKVENVLDLCKPSGAIFFMFPKANTPGCTTQACGYRDNHDKIVKEGFKVYGLSADSIKSLTNWKKKHEFQYTLLSDKEKVLIGFFGAKKGESISRSHVIVDGEGLILDLQLGVKPGSFEKATEFIVKK